MKFFNPSDGHCGTASSCDTRAHGVEEGRQVHYLRLARGAFNHGYPFSEHRSHHDVGRAQDGGTGSASQKHRGTDQAFGGGLHVARLNHHFGSQRFKSFQMQINRPGADHASAWK